LVILVEYLILVLLQVFFRYVLNESLFWAEEAVRFSDPAYAKEILARMDEGAAHS
jgi:hypothetical protein